ncbi:unnamed protein product [Phytomonas sp. Hart1]|nr:unnamed protein product [Phytomonas sp. Hart1]|eukprot:CCW72265.1 unnamed protein product [Phytomonas sp. isolate Hart1]
MRKKERLKAAHPVKKDESSEEEASIDLEQEDGSEASESNKSRPASVEESVDGASKEEKPMSVEINEPSKWVERMALTSTRALPSDLNADDDPKREEAFIQQTLLSVMQGISLLERAEVPWKRPDDYYAEMYKDDVHMNNVRRAMEATKARIEAQAHRRAMKDQKKYGKEIQAEVLRQRAKHKRDMQERLSSWKKKRGGDEAMRDILNNDEDGEGPSKRRKNEPRRPNLKPGGKSKRPGKNARHRR